MKLLTFMVLTIMASSTWGHPVGYGDSLSILSHNNPGEQSNTIHYSPSYRYSLGATVLTKEDYNAYFARTGILLKRWNTEISQANAYVVAGVGRQQWDDPSKKDEMIYKSEAILDYETRKIFTMFKYERLDGKNLQDQTYHLKLGYAPYLGNYNELNTWFMVHYKYNDLENKGSVMPMLRWYYKNVLWAIGANTNGKWMFNIAIREFF